jgi:hypothetical protein
MRATILAIAVRKCLPSRTTTTTNQRIPPSSWANPWHSPSPASSVILGFGVDHHLSCLCYPHIKRIFKSLGIPTMGLDPKTQNPNCHVWYWVLAKVSRSCSFGMYVSLETSWSGFIIALKILALNKINHSSQISGPFGILADGTQHRIDVFQGESLSFSPFTCCAWVPNPDGQMAVSICWWSADAVVLSGDIQCEGNNSNQDFAFEMCSWDSLLWRWHSSWNQVPVHGARTKNWSQ